MPGPTNPRAHHLPLLYFLILPPSRSPPIHNLVIPLSPFLPPLLSQSSPVRGSTHIPCLPLSSALRYTSTDAIRPARSAHETRTDYRRRPRHRRARPL